MANESLLTSSQIHLLGEFYTRPLQQITLSKKQRQEIWHGFKNERILAEYEWLLECCPALFAELKKAVDSDNLIQSAVFSECVYAQALASMFGLTEFTNYLQSPAGISEAVLQLLHSQGLVVRYVYKNSSGSRILIQAGGNGGVDSALVSIQDNRLFTIEFKEPAAKSPEPDLPKYGEDGLLTQSGVFCATYPQFASMIEEQIAHGLNFFAHMGSNANNFTVESVKVAVIESYNGQKFADVICTEDSRGYLTMMPANHAHVWASLQGEIRPSGRNHYQVWTPKKLASYLVGLGASIVNDSVTVPANQLKAVPPRGGKGISRYKINPLFFVRASDVSFSENVAEFQVSDVRQLNPTIAAKMFFKKLDARKVKKYYEGDI